jgi:hypothetical protein
MWRVIRARAALYADHGKSIVLCDRLPRPVTLLVEVDVKMGKLAELKDDLKEAEDAIATQEEFVRSHQACVADWAARISDIKIAIAALEAAHAQEQEQASPGEPDSGLKFDDPGALDDIAVRVERDGRCFSAFISELSYITRVELEGMAAGASILNMILRSPSWGFDTLADVYVNLARKPARDDEGTTTPYSPTHEVEPV